MNAGWPLAGVEMKNNKLMNYKQIKLAAQTMAGVLMMLGGSVEASPVATFYWSETGSSYGDANGVLTVTDTGYFNDTDFLFTVDSFTGNFTSGTDSGDSITFNDTGSLNGSSNSSLTPGNFLGEDDIQILIDGNSAYINGIDSATTIHSGTSDGGSDVFTISTTAPAPEPGTLALGALGGLALWRFRKRS
jgi:MYXO-CTERM domain-containing protein